MLHIGPFGDFRIFPSQKGCLMHIVQDRAYYAGRAAKARALAQAATDPGIRKIHEHMALRYEDLAEQSPLRQVSLLA